MVAFLLITVRCEYVASRFCDRMFYVNSVGAWMKSKKMEYLGVPKYWGSGFHEKNGKR